ncbi:MAG: SDR family oxidoreductase [Alphaproteobacteria bacterium]|nr:SDR family oxidoreductase [Alphaproteobacteria bacterium]
MRLAGKAALVTGGNSGIGRGIVHRFVAEGALVAFVGRDGAKGAKVQGEVGEKGAFIQADLAHEDQCARAVAEAVGRFGRLDIVVNNAGVGGRRSGIGPDDGPGARWQKMRGPNLDAPLFVAAYAMPHLARAGRGAIVNISSTAAVHGNWGLYTVAKAGVEALTRSLAAEGAPHGVRANGVSPGWIAIEADGANPPSGKPGGDWDLPPSLFDRMGTPAEIAAAVVFLASDEASFVTGQTLIVDGGLTITDYASLTLLRGVGAKLFPGTIDVSPKGAQS